MRAVLIAALLFATPAFAVDKDATIKQIYDADFACQQGQNHDGEPLDDATIKVACLDVTSLLKEMETQGYCYDKTKLAWWKCT